MKRRYLIMLLLLIPFCTECTKADRGVSLALDRAGRCMEQFPDSALMILESTRSAYSLSHPGFIEYLKDKGLTDREIACCCLYCTGLNGSEISSYLEIKSFYNVSAVIRKKLSVDRSMNIDTYLRKLLKTL